MKSKFRAIYVLIGGKRALVCGYGDVGKGCASALRCSGALAFIAERDPICALQVYLEGVPVAAIRVSCPRSTWLAWRAWNG